MLVAFIALGALWEFYRIAEKTGHPVSKSVGILFGGLVLGDAAILWGPVRFMIGAGPGRDHGARARRAAGSP